MRFDPFGLTLLAVAATLTWGGCSTSSTPAGTDLVGLDASLDAASGSDAELVIQPDLPEVLTEVRAEVFIEPEPSFVFEEFEHPGCVPDGPYEVDRRQLVRTGDLEYPEILSVLPRPGGVLLATPGPLYFYDEGPAMLTEVGFDCIGDCRAADMAGMENGDLLLAEIRVIENDDSFDSVMVWQISGGLDVEPLAEFECKDCQDSAIEVAACGDEILVSAGGKLFSVSDGEQPQAAQDVACAGGVPWVAAKDGLFKRPGQNWEKVWAPDSGEVIRVTSAKQGVWAATSDRVLNIDPQGEVLTEYQVGLGQLPEGDFTALALSPDQKRLAIGHQIGLTVVDLMDGTIEHFHSLRWLPGEKVNDLDFDDNGRLWAATDGGAAMLYKDQIMLRDKADGLLTQLNAWFWRMDGFITAQAGFDQAWLGNPTQLWDDDNDGQWTEEGVGAFCYAYAVTGDEKYYEAAKKAVTNMLMLIDVPAVDFEEAGLGRGFITRSLVRDDEGECFAGKATQDNWRLVHYSDGHDYYWKDDTSSDETTGHFFGLPIYYDLCAKDDEERAWVAEHITALAGFILDHGYKLVDLDGEATTHGDFSPERLAIAVDGIEKCMADGHDFVSCVEAWYGAAYLDSIEILGHMLSAWHVSGELRFLEAYLELIEKYRFDELAMFHDEVATWVEKGLANYCDHELADLSWLTLIRYEYDEERRQKWIKSMLASWEYEVEERNPLKALSMAAVVSDSPGLEAGVRTLVEYPEDLRDWLVDNSYRKDVLPDVNDRHGDPQFKSVLPYDEIPLQRWDHNPYGMKGGGDGRSRKSPAFWLLPYWGLRYYGAICPAGGR